MFDVLIVMFLYVLLSLVLNNYYYLKIKKEINDLREELDGKRKNKFNEQKE